MFIAAAVFLAALPPSPSPSTATATATTQVVLVGVRSEAGLETYVVDGAGVRRVARGIAVPQLGRLVRVDVENEGGVDRLVVTDGPRTVRTTPPQPLRVGALSDAEAPPCAHPTLRIELLAVSRTVVSWEQTQDCAWTPEETSALTAQDEAMIHRPYDWKAPPYEDPSFLTVARVGNLDAAVAVDDDVGAPAHAALDRVLGTLRQSAPAEWGISRAHGAWVARAKVRPAGSDESEPPKLVTLGAVIPPDVIAPSAPAGLFERVTKGSARIIDAAASDDGRVVITVSHDGIASFVDGAATGAVQLKSAALVLAMSFSAGDPALAALLRRP
jgi:hypothetical protein